MDASTKAELAKVDYHTILLGGGVDSSALLSLVEKSNDPSKILIVHISYGQKAVSSERLSCIAQARKYNIPKENLVFLSMDLGFASCGIMPQTDLDTSVAANNVLELRNPMLINLAACYLATKYPGLIHYLYVGFHKEPSDTAFKDAVASRYITSLSESINGSLSNPKTKIFIRAPFKHRTRERILKRLIRDRGLDFVTNFVHTCYERVPCGTCTHCVWLNNQLNIIKESSND
jgi:7-cyano-7-deazaguanine synthase in queuosine biosynthesis